MNIKPEIAVKGLRSLFPNSKFGSEIIISVCRGKVTSIVSPSPVTESEIEAAAALASPAVAECIALGEQAVAAAGLTASRLVTLMDLLIQTKEANALASKPKLVALYTWLQTVKGMAIAGQTDFPAAPHTFEDVVSE